MIRALKHLEQRDKRALAVFFGIALLCSLYFASGILVSYVSSPSDAIEMSKDGNGFTVSVSGLQTFADAEQLSQALRTQRQVITLIEAVPPDQGYLVKIGPLASRDSAEMLSSELQNSGYSMTRIVKSCAPGRECGPPESASPLPGPTQNRDQRNSSQ